MCDFLANKRHEIMGKACRDFSKIFSLDATYVNWKRNVHHTFAYNGASGQVVEVKHPPYTNCIITCFPLSGCKEVQYRTFLATYNPAFDFSDEGRLTIFTMSDLTC
jgi:hypothetical protein